MPVDKEEGALVLNSSGDYSGAHAPLAGTTSSVYYSLRDYPNLIDASKRALLFDPNNSDEHYLLGTGYEGTGKLQEVIS